MGKVAVDGVAVLMSDSRQRVEISGEIHGEQRFFAVRAPGIGAATLALRLHGIDPAFLYTLPVDVQILPSHGLQCICNRLQRLLELDALELRFDNRGVGVPDVQRFVAQRLAAQLHIALQVNAAAAQGVDQVGVYLGGNAVAVEGALQGGIEASHSGFEHLRLDVALVIGGEEIAHFLVFGEQALPGVLTHSPVC